MLLSIYIVTRVCKSLQNHIYCSGKLVLKKLDMLLAYEEKYSHDSFKKSILFLKHISFLVLFHVEIIFYELKCFFNIDFVCFSSFCPHLVCSPSSFCPHLVCSPFLFDPYE